MIRKILRKIKHLVSPKSNVIVEKIYNSYSQAGEDVVLTFLLTDKNITEITYLDIGTNIPDYCNNTYLLYKNGHTGVCVEADQTLIANIKKVRPRDIILNVGVAVTEDKEADFYIFNFGGLNTFDKVEAEKREAFGTYKVVETVKVPLANINNIIKEYFASYPDFLSIDIEGLDLDVLKSLDFAKYPIPIICVETCTYSENHVRPKDLSIAHFFNLIGYEVYADTYINTIFINKEWFYSIPRSSTQL